MFALLVTPLSSRLRKKITMYVSLLMVVPACHRRLISVASKSEDINGIMAPMLQITQELHELCVESSVMLPLDVGSLETLALATTLSPHTVQPREFHLSQLLGVC
jgi:hypothetical protein